MAEAKDQNVNNTDIGENDSLCPNSQSDASSMTISDKNKQSSETPSRSSKRPNPESPDDLPATEKQQTRQIRRRNSVGDLSSILPKKTPALRKTVTDKLIDELTSSAVLDKIVPVLASKISETIADTLNKTIESHVKTCIDNHITPLIETVKKQQETINEQKQIIKKQAELIMSVNKTAVSNEQSCAENDREINELYRRINELEFRLENQEQYSRRTSLRFHNISVPVDAAGKIIHPVNTDDLILNICNQKLNLGIQKEDISRSHFIGNVRNGKSQVIVRFLSYRIRERVYNAKKNLKGNTDKIFITENLTKYRTSMVKTLSELKFTGKIVAYWTIDGRIYANRSESSRKKLIQSLQ